MKNKNPGLWLGAAALLLGLAARGVAVWQQNNILIYGSAGALRALTWAARALVLAGAALLGGFLAKALLAKHRAEAEAKPARHAALSRKNGRLNEQDIRDYLTRLLTEAPSRFQPQLERYQAQLDRMNSYQDRLHVMVTQNDLKDNGAAERFLDALEQRLFSSMRAAYNIITIAGSTGESPELTQRLADIETVNQQCLDLGSRLCMTVLDHVNSRDSTVDITESIEHYINYLEEEIQE